MYMYYFSQKILQRVEKKGKKQGKMFILCPQIMNMFELKSKKEKTAFLNWRLFLWEKVRRQLLISLEEGGFIY